MLLFELLKNLMNPLNERIQKMYHGFHKNIKQYNSFQQY